MQDILEDLRENQAGSCGQTLHKLQVRSHDFQIYLYFLKMYSIIKTTGHWSVKIKQLLFNIKRESDRPIFTFLFY